MATGTYFSSAVVACLLHGLPQTLITRRSELDTFVERVLDELAPVVERKQLRLPNYPTAAQLEQYLDEARSLLGDADRIALIAGGATRIKGYVFEAPKLPEIRGASALLDWVNDTGLRDLWRQKVGKELDNPNLAEQCIIYASGGGFLAFAPADMGDELAAAVEQCYNEHTLTANSVAVAETFSLLELRYGRLVPSAENEQPYWIEAFLRDWGDAAKQRALAQYYYPPPEPFFTSDEERLAVLHSVFGRERDPASPLTQEDKTDLTLAARFFNRKTFGELVTLLATMTSRRRDERASHGPARSVPRYQMLPWAEKCDSSDIRPAVWRGTVVGEERRLSEASARKRYVGQIIKKDDQENTRWYRRAFPHWQAPLTLRDRSWEHEWQAYIEDDKQRHTPYATYIRSPQHEVTFTHIMPPQDVGDISQASKPRRYLGVIYADGNNVGRLVATLKTPSAYRETSLRLSEAAKDAVFKALAHHLQPLKVILSPKERRDRHTAQEICWVHPFEILTIGGDDLFIIVPGGKALEIALTIAQEFEALLKDAFKPPDAFQQSARDRYQGTPSGLKEYTPAIGLSAGVVVAQENAPIFFLQDLVSDLLKSAKSLAREQAKGQFYGGAVDFMVMKSITMVTDTIKSFRQQALGDDGDKSARRLTARPYSWHEFAGLLQTVRALKQASVPRSQLHRLRRALEQEGGGGVVASVMEYLYTRARLRDERAQTLLKEFEARWCAIRSNAQEQVPQRGGLPPWMPLGEKGWETIWGDLLEAYEMVHLPQEQP